MESCPKRLNEKIKQMEQFKELVRTHLIEKKLLLNPLELKLYAMDLIVAIETVHSEINKRGDL